MQISDHIIVGRTYDSKLAKEIGGIKVYNRGMYISKPAKEDTCSYVTLKNLEISTFFVAAMQNIENVYILC